MPLMMNAEKNFKSLVDMKTRKKKFMERNSIKISVNVAEKVIPQGDAKLALFYFIVSIS